MFLDVFWLLVFFFFFKQKTAYEMRISDWSSDVCSSDLRFTTDEVWPKGILDAHPGYRGKSLFDVLFRNGNVDRFPLSEVDPGYANHEAGHFGFYVQKGLFEEYAAFGRGHGHDLAPYDR